MTNTKPSKSARKREHLALQELGEKLIALNAAELSSLSLDEELLTAVRDAADMKSNGALRRQKQLIGKIMRNVDADRIRDALHRHGAEERQAKRVFQNAEKWRDRLIGDGAAMTLLEQELGHADPDLRQMLADLNATLDERSEKTLRRSIFRHIHAVLVTRAQDG